MLMSCKYPEYLILILILISPRMGILISHSSHGNPVGMGMDNVKFGQGNGNGNFYVGNGNG